MLYGTSYFLESRHCIRELIPTIPEGLMVNPRANELTPQTLDFWKILITSRS